MDLISIESQQELDFLGKNMGRAGIREIWTSGRLCDKEVGHSYIFYIYRDLGQRNMDLWQAQQHGGGTLHLYTANEWPMKIQYKCLVPIYVFPEIKLRALVISKSEL
jgi:hypothetical protein